MNYNVRKLIFSVIAASAANGAALLILENTVSSSIPEVICASLIGIIWLVYVFTRCRVRSTAEEES
ncbi:MAG: hypothetical protein IKP47_07250 [Ruminococcus sp.]|nr:hypothetical protein [Ruminococcus sp.]